MGNYYGDRNVDISHYSDILYHVRGSGASKSLHLNKYIIIGFAETVYQPEIKHNLFQMQR